MIFVTSDQHYFHNNILKYCNRPFKTIEEMNSVLIKNHNSVVKNDDIVYHIGDVVMGKRKDNLKIISELAGTHILITGNHDYPFDKPAWESNYLEAGFKELHMTLDLRGEEFAEVGGHIRLQHFPVLEAAVQDHEDDIRYQGYRLPSNGSLHLSGHTHLKDKLAAPKNIHVGVDAWDYFPVSYRELVALYKGQGW